MAASRPTAPVSESFRVVVLGPFGVYRNGVPLEAGWQPRVASMFRMLVTAPGWRLSRDQLADGLWREATSDAGFRSLRVALHALRRCLGGGDPSPVLSEAGQIMLNPACQWEIDLDVFERISLGPNDAIPTLEDAVALCRGEPLVEDRYEEWATPVRERIVTERRSLHVRLARLYQERGRVEDALRHWEAVLALDPLDEDVLRHALRALVEMSRRTDALRRYRQFVQTLERELGVPPEPETVALVERLKGQGDRAPDHTPSPVSTTQIGIAPVIPRYPLPASPALVGRDVDVRRVLSGLTCDSTTAAQCVFIGAEAGMGKSRFLAEIALRARETGALTLAAGCYEQAGGLPYSPIHDALMDYIGAQSHALLRAQVDGLRADLSRLLPALAGETGEDYPQPAANEGGRLQLFSAVSRFFGRIAAAIPVVLLLDDMHWADESTLQLLHFLIRHVDTGQFLVVGAYRSDEAPSDGPLEQFVVEVERGGRGAPMTLDALAEDDVVRLAQTHLDGSCAVSLTHMLHRRAAGNPFFVIEILDLLRQEGRLVWGDEGWFSSLRVDPELPPLVQETVARRLRHLRQDEGTLLDVAAVLGRQFGYLVLEAMWEGEEAALFEALDAMVEAHLISETGQGYMFRHPLLHEVVYHRMHAHPRRRLHRRAGRVLQALYGEHASGRATELAWHFLEGDEPKWALPYTLMAGDAAEAVFAYSEAEQHYRTALKLMESAGAHSDTTLPGSIRLHADALLKLGRILGQDGRAEEALVLFERAVALYRDLKDDVQQGHALLAIATIHARTGFDDRRDATLQRARPLLERLDARDPTRDLALLYDGISGLCLHAGRYREQLAASDKTADVARSLGDDRLLLRADGTRAVALLLLGRLRDARRMAEMIVPRAEAADDLAVLGRVLSTCAEAAMLMGEFDMSYSYRVRALEVAEQLSSGGARHVGLTVKALLHFDLGRLALYRGDRQSAQTHAGRAQEIITPTVASWADAYVSLLRSEIALHYGDWEAVRRHAQDCASEAERGDDAQACRMATRVLSEYDLVAGEPGRALARLEHVLRCAVHQDADTIFLLPVLASSHLALDDSLAAERILDEGVQSATQENNRVVLTDLLRVQGKALSVQGRWTEAEAALDLAVSLAGSMPLPYAHARALWELGLLDSDKGDKESARLRLREAEIVFQTIGATRHAERVHAAVTSLDGAA